ncbi:MAG: hypothetical protein ABJB12_03125 [Pseudomonadota bacterium]
MGRAQAVRAALSCLAWSCAALSCAPAPRAVVKTPAAARAPAAPVQTVRARLAQALRSIPRPPPVLEALPLEAQQRLQARLAALDAERRLSVHSDDSELAETLPLLHLVSGGASPRALYALATTAAGAEEVTGLGLEPDLSSGAAKEDLRVSAVRELARRAALNFLRDRAADVALPGKGTALVCRLVARAAIAVGRRDLALLAHELLLEAEPGPDTRLEFARELAKDGQAERATAELREAASDQPHPASPGARAAVQQLIGSARVASAPAVPGADVNSRLRRARAWLRLGRVTEAQQALAGDAEAAKSRLDLAATLAETMIEYPSCPDLPLDVGNADLCSLAFGSNQRLAAARTLLQQAWLSGAGRDDAAVEVYVALELLLPWLHHTTRELLHGTLNPSQSAAETADLHARIAEMSGATPWLAGLSLFLETVHGAGTAGPSAQGTPAQAQALMKRALALLASDSSRFAQAGALAVAATVSHQQDVSALLDALPFERIAPSMRVPRVALEAWAAATSEARPRMEAARAELAAIMAAAQGSSLERARLVLTVSEADALFDSSQRAYQLLSRVAGQLLSDNIPPDLALRAVLDAAGALARGERIEQAQKILAGAAGAQLPPNLQRAQDELQLIRGYKLVLGVRGGSADAVARARVDLAALAAEVKGQSALVWFELWARELEASQRDAACAKKKQSACKEAAALRHNARAGLDARLGPEASSVLLRGALAGGSFEAGFRFSVEYGLEPLLSFDPTFLAIGLPRFTVN